MFCLVHKDKRGQTVAGAATKPSQMLLGGPSSGPVISQDGQISYCTQRGDPSYSGVSLFILGTSGFGTVFLPSDLSMSWDSALTVGSGLSFMLLFPTVPSSQRSCYLHSPDD